MKATSLCGQSIYMAKLSCYFTAVKAVCCHSTLTKLCPMMIMACLFEKHMHKTSANVMGKRAKQGFKDEHVKPRCKVVHMQKFFLQIQNTSQGPEVFLKKFHPLK